MSDRIGANCAGRFAATIFFFQSDLSTKRPYRPFDPRARKSARLRRHWIDLLTVEMASSFLWFNPLMIFYRRSLKIQHEYEADIMLTKRFHIEAYLYCILNHLQAKHSSAPISQFFNLNIKQRIIMMTKKKTPLRLFMLYLLFVPALCLMLLAFAKPSIRSLPSKIPLRTIMDSRDYRGSRSWRPGSGSTGKRV